MYWPAWFLVRPLFLACVWLSSHCVFTWWGERETKQSGFSFYKSTNPIMIVPSSLIKNIPITISLLHAHNYSEQWNFWGKGYAYFKVFFFIALHVPWGSSFQRYSQPGIQESLFLMSSVSTSINTEHHHLKNFTKDTILVLI